MLSTPRLTSFRSLNSTEQYCTYIVFGTLPSQLEVATALLYKLADKLQLRPKVLFRDPISNCKTADREIRFRSCSSRGNCTCCNQFCEPIRPACRRAPRCRQWHSCNLALYIGHITSSSQSSEDIDRVLSIWITLDQFRLQRDTAVALVLSIEGTW